MELLKTFLIEHNISATDDILEKFERYFSLLIEWNNKFNLTTIVEKKQVEAKHFIDSLTAIDLLNDGANICDIGSGAGFPSIPLAIVKPNCKFALVDSLAKRVGFLDEVIAQLGLDNCSTCHARAEDYASSHRNFYDICVARALAPMPTLVEYTLPLVKTGGFLLAYKAITAEEELAVSAKALSILGGRVVSINKFVLPDGDNRSIVKIEKFKTCNTIYPRGGNKPRTAPLV